MLSGGPSELAARFVEHLGKGAYYCSALAETEQST
jgi:hypothetical protein